MTPSLLRLVLIAALVSGCNAGEDACVEHRNPIGFDGIGPWGATPRATFSHAPVSRVGSLTWYGGGSVGTLQVPGDQAELML
ncbi:MAG: hypothetical protein KC431_07660, partial [Myxococcales bacterium]|nr:hypothetical protein [Myxococcales bacterium]